ncbi:TPA: DUF3141 domain-containing protein [Pseudomonas putida]|nr:DUF3141 domain-containing protein [Pseudomonas putida]HDS1799899.1 DUF3141 domain-containing protein [Pseudomonas putida]HDS1806293.1 DUF3141 domain-containing protein [Pseudomonas putida]
MIKTNHFATHDERFSSFTNLFNHITRLQKTHADLLLESLGQRQKELLAPAREGNLHLPNINQWWEYQQDLSQRTLLLWDTLRQRGDNTLEHERAGYPLLLKFAYEVVIDGRDLPHPVNYSLLRILPETDHVIDEQRRPVIIVDPRGGHGAGIGGFKQDSEIGESLRAGHPTYFIAFSRTPEPGQTLLDIGEAEARFIEQVKVFHPKADKPVLIGNCQAGWALMGLAAARPELPGLVIINGAPLSYWAGVNGRNPMRYAGGLLGGAWMTRLGSDMGNGRFDGTWLVSNFENLNPANTLWTKYYNLLTNVDSEAPRFLEFERWWGSPTLFNSEEIETIVDDLFIGNRLANGLSRPSIGIDLRRIEAPVVVFCSYGDNITPPQQALNWIADVYPSDLALRSAGRTIVYLRHASIGHLGIFVSGKVARREHRELLGAIETIGALPPGLFELIIDDLPQQGSDEMHYVVHFEQRSITDIMSNDSDGRDDEREFALAQRVSEVNSAFYDWMVRPLMRLMINEPVAEALRRLHPFHQQQVGWSSLNPALWWLAGSAARVRENRRPSAPDNPLLAWQKGFSRLLETQLETYRDSRDAGQELLFHSVYGGLSTLTDSKQPATLEDRAPQWNQTLTTRLLDELPRGNSLEGLIRILFLVGQSHPRVSKDRIEQIVHQGRAMIEEFDVDPARLHNSYKLQGLLTFAHPRECLETLPLLIPVHERQNVLDATLYLLPELTDGAGPAATLWRELHRVLECPEPQFRLMATQPSISIDVATQATLPALEPESVTHTVATAEETPAKAAVQAPVKRRTTNSKSTPQDNTTAVQRRSKDQGEQP